MAGLAGLTSYLNKHCNTHSLMESYLWCSSCHALRADAGWWGGEEQQAAKRCCESKSLHLPYHWLLKCLSNEGTPKTVSRSKTLTGQSLRLPLKQSHVARLLLDNYARLLLRVSIHTKRGQTPFGHYNYSWRIPSNWNSTYLIEEPLLPFRGHFKAILPQNNVIVMLRGERADCLTL